MDSWTSLRKGGKLAKYGIYRDGFYKFRSHESYVA